MNQKIVVMMYKVGDKTYHLSYLELQETYNRFILMTDEDFMKELHNAAHFACIVTWLKETGQFAVADDGIVHELIHLMSFPQDCNLKEIRELFNSTLKLS